MSTSPSIAERRIRGFQAALRLKGETQAEWCKRHKTAPSILSGVLWGTKVNARVLGLVYLEIERGAKNAEKIMEEAQ